MVVVSRRPTGPRGRRRRILGALLVLVAVFAAGALAQRAGILSGVNEILNRIVASALNPRQVVDSALHGEDLPEIRIDVKHLDMKRIEAKREEALERGLLISSGDDFVPAVLRGGEAPLRARIRLKGDILDHIVTRKWSLRIHMRGNDRYRGMRRFSVQHPKTRFYLHEWGFLETMRREDIVAPRYSFATVVLNGKDKGIFAVEEAFAREMIESHRRREGILIRLDEDPFHRWFHDQPVGADAGTDVNPVSDRNVEAEPFDSGRVLGDEGLTRQWRRGRALLLGFFRTGELGASETFDAEMLGRYLAICELWGAIHPMRWGNIRFYYNPLKDRIEPVAYDGSVMSVGGTGQARLLALGQVREGLPGVPWTRRALRDLAVAESYLKTLRRILTETYVDGLERDLGDRWNAYATTLGGEFPGEPALQSPWKRLKIRGRMLRRALRAKRHVLAHRTTSEPSAPEGLVIEAASALTVPVEITEVIRSGVRHDISVVLPALNADGSPAYVSVAVPGATAGHVESLELVTRILGYEETRTTSVGSAASAGPSGIPDPTTRDQCLGRHPFIAMGPGLDFVIRAGRHDVTGDLVLPAGATLTAEPGTTLRFSTDAMFVARGALRLVGTEEAPIVLEPRGDSWRGLAVIGAKDASKLTHVRIRGTTGVARDGWVLTSGVTFHESPVYLRSCRFSDHAGLDDQLNIFRTKFRMVDCEFGTCTGDAYDGDFVEGEIVNCAFHDVGGDAIDFSGSHGVVVRDTRLLRVADKGLSAGENSRIRGVGLLFRDVGIAVAAKDRSLVTIRDSAVHGGRYVLAAYQKKPEFGPAAIVVESGLETTGDATLTIVQTGSRITIGKRVVEGSELDVDRMYEEGILGN